MDKKPREENMVLSRVAVPERQILPQQVITAYYQDNGVLGNYYLNSIVTSHVAFPQYTIEDNEKRQGKMMSVFYSSKDFIPGDVVNIKLYGISKRYYDYFNKLLLASGSDGGPFPTTPAAVRGNIVNQTNSKNFAYGYFRLSEVDTKSAYYLNCHFVRLNPFGNLFVDT